MKRSHLITLVIVLLALTTTNVWLLLKSKSVCDNNCCVNHSGETCYITENLSLAPNQKAEYDKIKTYHRTAAANYADSLHQTQYLLVEYMQKNPFDSSAIMQIEYKIQRYQQLLLNQSIKQYYDIKKILTSKEQISQLDSLYSNILVCRPTCKEKTDISSSHIHIH
ncbi:MAG: hypothetical protein LBR28_00510 [Bacteroidales bacterium]|jgi:Spy/CpxP family protein refolding chaperone|nr:hypothetical protein [Bacteroidales bacterium]